MTFQPKVNLGRLGKSILFSFLLKTSFLVIILFLISLHKFELNSHVKSKIIFLVQVIILLDSVPFNVCSVLLSTITYIYRMDQV